MTDTPSAGPGSTPPSDSRGVRDDRAAWGAVSAGESRWPPVLAVVVAIALQVVLPESLLVALGPRWLVPAVEGVLLVALLIANPHQVDRAESNLRLLSLAMIAVITVANVIALGELILALLDHT